MVPMSLRPTHKKLGKLLITTCNLHSNSLNLTKNIISGFCIVFDEALEVIFTDSFALNKAPSTEQNKGDRFRYFLGTEYSQ
jgi:hypothetical protein